jgi:hypothetical protein
MYHTYAHYMNYVVAANVARRHKVYCEASEKQVLSPLDSVGTRGSNLTVEAQLTWP